MRLTLLLAALLISGCGPHKKVLRDLQTYKAEVDQYDYWAVEQAKHLRAFIEKNCRCESEAEGNAFDDPECERAADLVLTIEARHEWHKQMSLYNAGIIEEKPAEQPPEIPPLVCPLLPAPE